MSKLLPLVLLAACDQATPQPFYSQSTSALTYDMSAAWERRTIAAPGLYGTLTLRGADGVATCDIDADGDLDVVSPWENGARTTVSLRPASPGTTAWPIVILPGSVGAAEDAKCVDVDNDGRLDVVTASENGRIYVHFAPVPASISTPSAWTQVTIAAATNQGPRWMQTVHVDVTGDGVKEICAGGKLYPARISCFASVTPRTGSSWTQLYVGPVGWAMSLEALDMDGDGDKDLVVSDRTYIASTPRDYSLQGSRWLENNGTGTSWTNRTIYKTVSGDGEMKFLHVVNASNIFDGASTSTVNQLTSRTFASSAWSATALTLPSSIGQYHDVEPGDIDSDGNQDLVISCSNADGALSGVVWMRGDGAGGYTRGEISGADGVKFDNVRVLDVDGDGLVDVLNSEQDPVTVTAQLGVVYYVNPGPTLGVDGAPDAGPDASVDASVDAAVDGGP